MTNRVGRAAVCTLAALMLPAVAAGQDVPEGKKGPPGLPKIQPPKSLAGRTLSEWALEIRHRDPSIRENAIRTVRFFGEDAKDVAADNLIKALSEKDTSCRVAAVMTIGEMGGLGKPADTARAVARLTSIVARDTQSLVRCRAATALGRIGAEARPALDVLSRSMFDRGTWEVRKAAAFALGMVGRGSEKAPPDARAIGALAKGLRDPSHMVRRQVVQSIMLIGAPPSPADQLLLKQALAKHAFRDPDDSVAIWSRVCYMRVDPVQLRGKLLEKNIEALREFLGGEDLAAACEAAQALGTIGFEARSAVPELVTMLSHEQMACQVNAAWALGQMGTAGDPAAVPKLKELAGGDEKPIKNYAKEALAVVTGEKEEYGDPFAEERKKLEEAVRGLKKKKEDKEPKGDK